MKKFKHMKGITLIALIITIIVLLILAGVVINMTLGNEGIIGKAQSAVDMYKNAQEEGKIALSKYENEIADYIRGSRENTLNDWELLAKSDKTTLEECTVNDLSTYKFIALITYLNHSSSSTGEWCVCSNIVPISVLKKLMFWQVILMVRQDMLGIADILVILKYVCGLLVLVK